MHWTIEEKLNVIAKILTGMLIFTSSISSGFASESNSSGGKFVRVQMNQISFWNDRNSASDLRDRLERVLTDIDCLPRVSIEAKVKTYLLFSSDTQYFLDASATCPVSHKVEVRADGNGWTGPKNVKIYVDGRLK